MKRIFTYAASTIALLGLALILSPMFTFVVDERELAVVLQFGRPVREATAPGLYFKNPFTETVRFLPSTMQFWGDLPEHTIPDLPTRDDKKIELVPWAVWRIKSPIVFVQSLRTVDNAEQRVSQFVRGAMRDVITQHELAELVRSTSRELQVAKLDFEQADGTAAVASEHVDQSQSSNNKIEIGRNKILEQIKKEIQSKLSASSDDGSAVERGIELVDVGISRIDFVTSVREKTFDRWIAERAALSALNVNEGERLRQEIINQAKAEVERIEGEGKSKASKLKGTVDAEVIGRYAQAIQQTGDFFTLVRTLELYEKSIDSQSKLILTTDSELLRLLKSPNAPVGTAAGVSPPVANPTLPNPTPPQQ